MANDVTEEELVRFTQKLIKELFPSVNPVREKITPRICAWALKLSEEMLLASAGITFLETIWKGTFPAPAKLKKIKDVIDLLGVAAKSGVKAYLNGERKLMVAGTVRLRWRSIVEGYFGGGGGFDENDFTIPVAFADNLKQLFDRF